MCMIWRGLIISQGLESPNIFYIYLSSLKEMKYILRESSCYKKSLQTRLKGRLSRWIIHACILFNLRTLSLKLQLHEASMFCSMVMQKQIRIRLFQKIFDVLKIYHQVNGAYKWIRDRFELKSREGISPDSWFFPKWLQI